MVVEKRMNTVDLKDIRSHCCTMWVGGGAKVSKVIKLCLGGGAAAVRV